jgi:hypothetical protein
MALLQTLREVDSHSWGLEPLTDQLDGFAQRAWAEAEGIAASSVAKAGNAAGALAFSAVLTTVFERGFFEIGILSPLPRPIFVSPLSYGLTIRC